jgi:hypothetical protein
MKNMPIITIDWPRRQHGTDRTVPTHLCVIFDAVTGEPWPDVTRFVLEVDVENEQMYADVTRVAVTQDGYDYTTVRCLVAPCIIVDRVAVN